MLKQGDLRKFKRFEGWLPMWKIDSGIKGAIPQELFFNHAWNAKGGPEKWELSRANTMPHGTVLKQGSSIFLDKKALEESSLATQILSRQTGIFDGEIQFSARVQEAGQVHFLFRQLDIFNHYAVEMGVSEVNMQKMTKGNRVQLMKRKGYFFNKFLWHRVAVRARNNQFTVWINPEGEDVDKPGPINEGKWATETSTKPVLTAQDDAQASGDIGFGCSNSQNLEIDAVALKSMECQNFPPLDTITIVDPKCSRMREMYHGLLDNWQDYYNDPRSLDGPGLWEFAKGDDWGKKNIISQNSSIQTGMWALPATAIFHKVKRYAWCKDSCVLKIGFGVPKIERVRLPDGRQEPIKPQSVSLLFKTENMHKTFGVTFLMTPQFNMMQVFQIKKNQFGDLKLKEVKKLLNFQTNPKNPPIFKLEEDKFQTISMVISGRNIEFSIQEPNKKPQLVMISDKMDSSWEGSFGMGTNSTKAVFSEIEMHPKIIVKKEEKSEAKNMEMGDMAMKEIEMAPIEPEIEGIPPAVIDEMTGIPTPFQGLTGGMAPKVDAVDGASGGAGGSGGGAGGGSGGGTGGVVGGPTKVSPEVKLKTDEIASQNSPEAKKEFCSSNYPDNIEECQQNQCTMACKKSISPEKQSDQLAVCIRACDGMELPVGNPERSPLAGSCTDPPKVKSSLQRWCDSKLWSDKGRLQSCKQDACKGCCAQKKFLIGANIKMNATLDCHMKCFDRYVGNNEDNNMISTFISDLDVHNM